MAKQSFVAIFLSFLMLSGCFGDADSTEEVKENDVVIIPYKISASWDKDIPAGDVGEIVELSILIDYPRR